MVWNVILAILGTVMCACWIVLYMKNKDKYEEYIVLLDPQEYFMKDFYGIGYSFVEMMNVDFNSSYFQKRINKIGEAFGKKNARFVVVTDLAAQCTFVLTFLPLGLLVTVMADEIVILVVAIAMILLMVLNVVYDKNTKIEKRHEDILRDFPHMLSQMALLINAGMPLRDTIDTAAKKEGGVLYQELKTLNSDMKNGVPEYEALREFADRCGVDEVRKLSSMIIQNMRKGSSELASSMMELSAEVWRNRTSQVRELGEKASNKLMIPVLMIFVGILIMVVLPMARNMSI